MKKRLVSFLLAICLMAAATAAFSEGPAERSSPGKGYDFEIALRLHPEAFSESAAKNMKGYADLLDALTIKGSFTHIADSTTFHFRLSVIPREAAASPIELYAHGAEDVIFLESNLLGEEKILLGNYALLAFFLKMSEHLNLPIYYPVLLYPFTWKYGLRFPAQDLEAFLESADDRGVLSAEASHELGGLWNFRVENDDAFRNLVDALSKNSELDETFKAVVRDIPDYFRQVIVQRQDSQLLRKDGTVIWKTASGDVYRSEETDEGFTINTDFPVMQAGYQPVFDYRLFREGDRQSGSVQVKLLATNDLLSDLLDFQASFLSFPLEWPAETQSLLSVSLKGGILPNVGFSAYLSAEENGQIRMDIRKPTVDMEPGDVMLSVDGTITSRGDIMVPDYDIWSELPESFDILTANDQEIRAFLPKIEMPLLKSLLKFLIGVPTSSCQAIMDDLTETGLLSVVADE